MKLVTFEATGRASLGALTPAGQVCDLAVAARERGIPEAPFLSMQALIEAGEGAWDLARDLMDQGSEKSLQELGAVRLLAPLPRPLRLRDSCMFIEHMVAAGQRRARTEATNWPDPEAKFAELMATGNFSPAPVIRQRVVYYNGNHLAVANPGDEIVWPARSAYMDFELEWACVIGRPGRDIRREDAARHIFGYTIFNDWSARDVQLEVMTSRLGPCEGKDFANSLGPYIVTRDEITDPYNLLMTARVNGVEWSRGSTASMNYSFEEAIAQFSRDAALVPGEIIGSGTVLSGCGLEQGRRLQPDDLVELEVEGLGVLANRVVQTTAESSVAAA